MKPEIALAGRFPYEYKEVEVLYNQWLEAYESISNEYPYVKEFAEKLTERIKFAYKLFLERDCPNSRKVSNFCGDDSCMEKLDRKRKEEDDSFDGDFPLGNEKDMTLAKRYFSVHELALIQLGLAHTIDLEATKRNVPADHLRKGFMLELEGLWREAAKAYRKGRQFRSGEVYDREQGCFAKAKAERGRCPKCGSTDTLNTGSGEVNPETGDISLDTCTETWQCNFCGETFTTEADVYYNLVINWRYKYDKEGRTNNEDGEDFYDLEEGATYSLPYMSDRKLEIRRVKVDGDTITAEVCAGYDTVIVSNKGEGVSAYASSEYSVCGDCVHESLSMALTIKKD